MYEELKSLPYKGGFKKHEGEVTFFTFLFFIRFLLFILIKKLKLNVFMKIHVY